MNKDDSKDAQAADIAASAKLTWGSFQYDDAASLYMKLCADEKERGREVMLKQFSFPIPGLTVGPVVIFDENVLKGLKASLSVDVVDPEVVGEAGTAEVQVWLKDVNTVTEMLHFLRDQSWDLWCGVPYIAKFVFPELDLGHASTVHALGIICWLLKTFNFVTDDEPFKGWDT